MNFINIALAGPLDDAPPVSSYLETIIQFLVTVVGALAILVILIAGIMYMTSGGNEERVKFAKKALLGGIIGLCVAVLSLIVVKIIVGFVA